MLVVSILKKEGIIQLLLNYSRQKINVLELQDNYKF